MASAAAAALEWGASLGKAFRWVEPDTPLSSLPVVLCCCGLYLLTLYVLKLWMKRRAQPYQLQAFTFLHNLFLSGLSLAMFSGLLYAIYFMTVTDSWDVANCDAAGKYVSGRLAFWSYVFYLSKYYEWVDTFLLVLKKKSLSFLHVYHHVLTLLISWGQLHTDSLTCWEPVLVNCLIHVVMYYYYAVRTVGIEPWWKRFLTQAQIIQFILVLSSTWWKGYLLWSGQCRGSFYAWSFGQLGIFSFLILFVQFYLATYRKARSRPDLSKKSR